MSSPTRPSVLPVSKAGVKKKRPNFRPTSRPKQAAAAPSKPAFEATKQQQQQQQQPPSPPELDPTELSQNNNAKQIDDVPPSELGKAAISTEPDQVNEVDEEVQFPHGSNHDQQQDEDIAFSKDEFDPLAALQKPIESPQVASAKKTGKRKKIGVPVGATRLVIEPPPDNMQQQQQSIHSVNEAFAEPVQVSAAAGLPGFAAAAPIPPILPVADPNVPTMANFCSTFRTKRTKRDKNDAASATKSTKQGQALSTAFNETSEASITESAPSAPQVQVINGEIVLNESSIIVAGTTPAGSGQLADTDDFTVVEEEAQLAVVGASYNSFVSRRAPQHWTVDETKLFYDALRQVGTDFGTMEAYFNTTRTRKQLKRKFQIESTKNPTLIDNALNVECMKEIDMSVFNVTEEDHAVVAAAAQARQLVAAQIVDADENMQMELSVETAISKEGFAHSNENESSEIVVRKALTTSALDSVAATSEPMIHVDAPPDDPLFMLGTIADKPTIATTVQPKRTTSKPKFRAKPRALPRRK
ncbi:hypothetical protein MPSEU_000954200 [Mayamaea pseudoterrestris]|nr:hypothetical protein MPSEU_000954200 [Mayamaea pseudoterrestris]